MKREAIKCLKEQNSIEAICVMEELIRYSLEIYGFEDLACSDFIMTYIERLKLSGLTRKALEVL